MRASSIRSVTFARYLAAVRRADGGPTRAPPKGPGFAFANAHGLRSIWRKRWTARGLRPRASHSPRRRGEYKSEHSNARHFVGFSSQRCHLDRFRRGRHDLVNFSDQRRHASLLRASNAVRAFRPKSDGMNPLRVACNPVLPLPRAPSAHDPVG